MATVKTAHLKLAENRKAFNKALKNLRESGIIPKKTDLRSTKPTAHYLKLIRQNDDIAKGRAMLAEIKTQKALKALTDKGDEIVTRGKKSYLKSKMITDANGRVVERHTARVLADGSISRTYKKRGADGARVNVTQKELPVKFENMEQWMTDAYNSDFKLKKGEMIYFTFFGNYSRKLFSSFEDAFKYLMEYDAFQKALDGDMSHEHMVEMVKGIGIQTTTKYATKGEYARERITDPSKDFSRKGKRKHKKENALDAKALERKKKAEHKKRIGNLLVKKK